MATVSKVALLGGRVIPVQVALVKRFGMGAALLIQQVHFWCSTNPNYRDGHKWCFNTHKVWAEQLGCCERKVRYIVRALREKNILLIGNFNAWKTDRTAWYRLNYAALEDLGDAASDRHLLPDGSGNSCHIEAASFTPPIPEMNVKKTQRSPQSVVPDGTSAVGQPDSQIENGQGEVKEEKGKHGENEGVLEKKSDLYKNKLRSEKLFLKRLSESSPTLGYEHCLTQKQANQCRLFGKYLNDLTEPVMNYVFDNWWKFAHSAKAAAGLAHAPVDPEPGYLLKHRRVAVELYLQSIAAPVSIAPTSEPPATPDAALKEMPYVPSDEEYMKIIAVL